MMLDLLFSLVLLICLLAVSRSATIAEMTPDVYTDLSYSSCVNQGYSYYDSPSQTCVTCGTGFSPNRNLTDALGDYVECECALGYYATYVDCANTDSYTTGVVTRGSCVGMTCTACSVSLGSGGVSWSDKSGCTTCNSGSTSGIGLDLECNCPSESYHLQEYNKTSGAKLGAKECWACPSGTKRISTSQTIAGVYYYADRYTCQSCPDPHMLMSVSDGVYSCTCGTGYTLTGISSVGP